MQEGENKQPPWLFNHRTKVHNTLESGSESSDSEPQAETEFDPAPEETRLFREFDISSRHETVEYKPNPWSIARINAASRSSNIKEPCGQASSENTRRKPHSRVPQGRIVDAFKVQEERKPPHAPAPWGSLQKDTKLNSNVPQASQRNRLTTQTKGRVVSGEYSHPSDASFHNRSFQSGQSCVPGLLSTPQKDPQELLIQPRLCVSIPCWESDSERGDIPVNARSELQRYITHISTSDTPAILSSSGLLEDTPDQQGFQERSRFPIPSWTTDNNPDDSPIHDERILERDVAHISATDRSLPASSRRNMPFESFSSPVKSDSPLYTPKGYQSSPLRSSHRTYTNVHTPSKSLPPTSINQSLPYFLSHSLDPLQASSALSKLQVPGDDFQHLVQPASIEQAPPSMPQWLISTMHSSLNAPKTQPEIFPSSMRHGVDPVFLQSKNYPCRSLTPSPPPPPPPKSVQMAVPKRKVSCASPGVSACTFEDDPDANWSTIVKPKKKHIKRFKPSVTRHSAPFRLPAPIVGLQNDVTLARKKQDIPPKGRAITYLPPPPPQRPVATLLHIGELRTHDNDVSHPKLLSAAQPPEGRSPRSPLLEAHSDDLTLVGDVDEQVFAFDTEEVKTRYPKVRRLAKETRVKLPELLDLPSCGVVWQEHRSADADASRNEDIKINTWPCVG